MKKTLIILLSIFMISFNKITTKAATGKSFFTMGTYVEVNLYNQGSEADYQKIEEIYTYYDYLGSDSIRPDSPYQALEYVYSINLKRNEAVTVNDDLFELIKFSMNMMVETNGYFNPLIGEAVDIWKQLIKTHGGTTISQQVYDETIAMLKEIPPIEATDIELDETNKTVKLLNHAKLDLGAIAKGYATEKAVQYIKSKNITTYNINAGSSSIAFGIHPENRPFSTGLNDPYRLYKDNIFEGQALYAIIKVKDAHIVTSGDYLQYVKYGDKILHHILDPHDYMPKNYYHTITIMGDDGGKLDAYSTAIFNMPEAEAISFLDAQNMHYSFYKKDEVTHNFSEENYRIFKRKTDDENTDPTDPINPLPSDDSNSNILILIFILSGIVVVFGSIITVMIIKERQQKHE